VIKDSRSQPAHSYLFSLHVATYCGSTILYILCTLLFVCCWVASYWHVQVVILLLILLSRAVALLANGITMRYAVIFSVAPCLVAEVISLYMTIATL
jgi:hypothetical protein